MLRDYLYRKTLNEALKTHINVRVEKINHLQLARRPIKRHCIIYEKTFYIRKSLYNRVLSSCLPYKNCHCVKPLC